MGSKRLLCALGVLVAMAAAAPSAGARTFVPRLGRAMGLIAPVGTPEIAVTPREPLVYHGGAVMRTVTVHTVFWAPAGYAFPGSPGPGAPAYEPLVQQFLADGAHDAGTQGNIFSVLAEYGDLSGPGAYALRYAAAADSINDADPYPAPALQCASPAGVRTCVTDLELQHELDRVIAARDPAGRGLHDLWVMLLPPNVDTCTSPGQCGTSAYAGYHSLFQSRHGTTIYALVVDPTIEGAPPAEADPEGDTDAEVAANVIAHEAVEAITDPVGTGWMDPDGFEAGDKCDSATGAPLGYAADGAPYNQLLNGHPYLIQTMWSNPASGCVQAGAPAAPPALPRVVLRQFSPVLSGGSGRPGRVGVTVALIRAGAPVAVAHTTSAANGSWRLTLRSIYSGAPIPVGDDRDVLAVRYGRGGPALELIGTDSGGNPFSEAGWTGWFDLDHGFAVARHAVAVAPCGQTGVLSLRVGALVTAAPELACQTETDVAVLSTPPIGLGTAVTFSSSDNRAFWPGDPAGALVRLTVGLGEPGAVPAVGNPEIPLRPSGFPTCTADLRAQTVRCSGLVAGGRYRLLAARSRALGRARADGGGVAAFAPAPGTPGIRGGDVLSLRNRTGRTVTALHVARLRVALSGTSRVIAGGNCEPGAYWGPPVSAPPVGSAVGAPTVGGTGLICPLNGRAAGLPATAIEQTDGFSGGVTETEVPMPAALTPGPGATVYGRFTALAEPALPAPHGGFFPVHAQVTLVISRQGSRRVMRRVAGVERAGGVAVTGLGAGIYDAVWTLTDPAGDTRVVRSYFVQAG